MGVDVAGGQVDAIADRPPEPHPRDRDVDVVVFDALPAREREALRRVEAVGVLGTVQAVGAAHAAVLLLDEEAGAERGELRPEAADVGHLALRRQHDEVAATGHEDGRGPVTLDLVETVAQDEGRQALRVEA